MLNRTFKVSAGAIFLILMLSMPASGIEQTSSPPARVSIAYNTDYTFEWHFTNGDVEEYPLRAYEIPASDFDECSTDVIYTSVDEKRYYPAKATLNDDTIISLSVSTISSDLSVRDTNGDFESDAAFGSGDSAYLCEIWQLTISNGDIIATDPIAVKIYQSDADIPTSEKAGNKTGLSPAVMYIGLAGILLIIVLLISSKDRY